MKIRFFLCCIFGLASVLGGAEELFSVEVPVSFESLGRIPRVRAEIQGVPLLLAVDTGAGCDLMLRKEALDRIGYKIEKETVHFMDVKGNLYPSATYQIPSIQIGRHEIFDVLTMVEDPQFVAKGAMIRKSVLPGVNPLTQGDGRIGIGLLCRSNILFDFPESITIDVLNQRPISNRSFVAPIEIGRLGIVVSIETDLGKRRFLVDTGANLTFFKKNLIDEARQLKFVRGLNRYKSRKFALGGENFGSKYLYLIDLPKELDQIDGILGIDFFIQHQIYIDYKNCQIYID